MREQGKGREAVEWLWGRRWGKGGTEKGRNREDGLERELGYLRCSCCVRQDRTKSMIKGEKTALSGPLRDKVIVQGHCRRSTGFRDNTM